MKNFLRQAAEDTISNPFKRLSLFRSCKSFHLSDIIKQIYLKAAQRIRYEFDCNTYDYTSLDFASTNSLKMGSDNHKAYI